MKELQTKIKWSFDTEAEFTTTWLKSLKDKGYYTDKISDASIGTKRVDCYISTDSGTYCCEIKVIDNEKFQLKTLRPNQWKSLRLWDDNWWSSIVVVYSKRHNKYKIIPFRLIAYLDKNDFVMLNFI